MRVEKKTRTRPSPNSIALVSGCTTFIVLFPLGVFILATKGGWNIAVAVSLAMIAFSVLGVIFCARGLYCWRMRREPLLVRRVATRVIAQTVKEDGVVCPEAVEEGVEMTPV
tara:strand:- start:410 stop:745 length:336 start_codon:yes stop_codon:yes gene_type:complete